MIVWANITGQAYTGNLVTHIVPVDDLREHDARGGHLHEGAVDAAVAGTEVAAVCLLGEARDRAEDAFVRPGVEGEERPQVVMTYNDFGFYGHPDHIQAHRITMAAVAQLDYEPTVYFNAIPKAVFAEFRARRREAAIAKGEVVEEDDGVDFGTPDEQIAAAIDISTVNGLKFDALSAHASQITEESHWMRMGREGFMNTMRTEWFVRATNPHGLEGVVTDLFAGYR